MLADAIECRATLNDHTGIGHTGELDGVVRLGEDALRYVLAHFARVDIERGNDLNVADMIGAHLNIHQSGDRFSRFGVAIKAQPLHKRRGAVAKANDGNANDGT